MNPNEIAISEYQALRAEILAIYSRKNNRLSIVWASISALIASSAVTKIPELICIAIFICCAGWNDEIKWYKDMMKIGTYIKCILEPQLPGLNLQKASRNSDFLNKTNSSSNLILNSYLITTLVVLITSCLLGFEFYPEDC